MSNRSFNNPMAPKTTGEASGARAAQTKTAPAKSNVDLKLKAVAGSAAVTNDKIIAEGQTAKIQLKSGSVEIRCLKVQANSVVIAVEGEAAPRTFYLNQ